MVFMKLTGEAVLSLRNATLVGRLPVDFSASARSAGTISLACVSAVGEVWKTNLKPRLVIMSE
jgi:hypothetical protein